MVYVTDVAEALVKCLKAASTGYVFDRAIEVGPADHNTVRQIAALVKELTNSSSQIVCLPQRPGEKEGAAVYADTSTLELIGMSADTLVPIRDGMKKTIEHYGQTYLDNVKH
jgi:UDP-glucose 4-epimerase